jgi:hypothetical protein
MRRGRTVCLFISSIVTQEHAVRVSNKFRSVAAVWLYAARFLYHVFAHVDVCLDAMELRREDPIGWLKLQMLASEEKGRLSS